MKRTIVYAVVALLAITSSCKHIKQSQENKNQIKATAKDTLAFKNGYSEVNGIKMYYEVYGQGDPLVLIHGGGSTIQTTFGRVIPINIRNNPPERLIGCLSNNSFDDLAIINTPKNHYKLSLIQNIF